jgi:hypothetical protein
MSILNKILKYISNAHDSLLNKTRHEIIMKIVKALLLTMWLYSLLLWFYIVLRITIDRIDPLHPFFDSVPSLSFLSLGMISFALSFACLFAYLVLNGVPGEARRLV